MGRTDSLMAPQTLREFSKDWAERIMLDYKMKYDKYFLKTPGVLRVLDVAARENPNPGMLSFSYLVQVSYKIGDKGFHVESWFAKIPKSPSTAPMDSVEAFMYNKMFPLLQGFSDDNYRGLEFKLPVPKAYFCAFDDNFEKKRNICVVEDLRGRGFKPLESAVCGVAYMRSTMRCLAQFHSSAVALQHHIGGRGNFLLNYPLITEKEVPKMSLVKRVFEQRLMAYILYLFQIHPDLKHQLMMLAKFEKHLFKVFKGIHKDEALSNLQILIHGDSKMDNFLFKKDSWAEEEQYTARLIDWQGVCFDILSSDLIWTLYGFMKNLPDKNSQVDSFLDYSVAFYHEELVKHLKSFGLQPEEVGLPGDDYDAVCIIKKGFVYDFLKVAILNPLVAMRNPDLLLEWFQDRDNKPLPSPESLFKGGQGYLNFIHLQFTIATEIGVFHDLAPLCFTVLKEAMFSGFGPSKESDDEDDAPRQDPGASGRSDLPEKGGRTNGSSSASSKGTEGKSTPTKGSGLSDADSKPGLYASMPLDLAKIQMPAKFNKRAASDPFNYRYKRRFHGKDQPPSSKTSVSCPYPVVILPLQRISLSSQLTFTTHVEMEEVRVTTVKLPPKATIKMSKKQKAPISKTFTKRGTTVRLTATLVPKSIRIDLAPAQRPELVSIEAVAVRVTKELIAAEEPLGVPIQVLGEVSKKTSPVPRAPLSFPDVLEDSDDLKADGSLVVETVSQTVYVVPTSQVLVMESRNDVAVLSNLKEISQGFPEDHPSIVTPKNFSTEYIQDLPQECQGLFQSPTHEEEDLADVSLMSTSADPSESKHVASLNGKIPFWPTAYSRQTTFEDDMSLELSYTEDLNQITSIMDSLAPIENTGFPVVLDNQKLETSTNLNLNLSMSTFPDVLDPSDDEGGEEVVCSTIYINA